MGGLVVGTRTNGLSSPIWLRLRLWLCIPAFACVSSEFQRLDHPIHNKPALPADASSPLISFLVIGDWGRKGSYNQSQLALQMGRTADKLKIDFVISTGDNFYDDGLTGIHDPAFQYSFSDIYTANSLQKQWYNVLGNHDYRGDVEAQLNPILHNIDHRWFCQRSFILHTAEIADFFFVDTTPFVDKYFFKPKDHKYDWRGVLPRDKYLSNLLKDLESALSDSTTKWKIVVGHHPIRSIGHHGDTKELLKHLLPILEANNVDMYMNGHDHCLEHISSTTSQIQFLTSGGGSKAWNDGVKFYYDGQGFMSIELDRMNAKVVYYNIFGNVLHVLNLSRGLHYAI